MAKYKFTQSERHAVYTTHGEKCYTCGRALTMKTVQIDHVVPESLADDPEALAAALEQLGLEQDFDLNSYENWMPACEPCNKDKRQMVWRGSLLAQLALQRAADRADRAREVADRLVSDKKIANAVSVLAKADDTGALDLDTKEALRPLVLAYVEDRAAEGAENPVHVTSGYTVPLYEVMSDDGSVVKVKGPYGVGGGPSGNVAPQIRCSGCGYPYFTGARCVICGMMDDD